MADFTFGTWDAPKEKVNPYSAVISALKDHVTATGNDLAYYEVRVPKGDAIKTRNLVAKAANDVDRTARVRVNAEPIIEAGADSGDVRFVFTLTKRHKSKNTAAESAAESDSEAEDVEAEDVEAEDVEAEDETSGPVAPSPAPKAPRK